MGSERRTSMDPGLESARTTRRRQTQHERNHPAGVGDLFAPPMDTPTPPVKVREEKLAALKEKLRTLAAVMLEAADERGVTFDDVRMAAETRGFLTGDEEGRTLSFGSGLMKQCGAIPTAFVKSRHRNSNGRVVRLWKLPQYATEREIAAAQAEGGP